MTEYDSTADTLTHSRRVAELIGQAITDLVHRSHRHDLPKTDPPEKTIFDEVTPLLRDMTYGSEEYRQSLASMGDALDHHYAHNRHHPEHFTAGIAGMTLTDLIEMLADWRAAGERSPNDDLGRSLEIQRERFGIEPQLLCVLRNTAEQLGWMPAAHGEATDSTPHRHRACQRGRGHDLGGGMTTEVFNGYRRGGYRAVRAYYRCLHCTQERWRPGGQIVLGAHLVTHGLEATPFPRCELVDNEGYVLDFDGARERNPRVASTDLDGWITTRPDVKAVYNTDGVWR